MEKLSVTTPGIEKMEIRTGDALPLRQPVAVKISGLISAPREFYEARRKLPPLNIPVFDLRTTHVLADEEHGQISLVQNESDPIATVVTGKLTVSKELNQLGINTDKCYSPLDLAKAIKKIRHLFPSKQEAMSLVTHLSTFTATVTNEVTQSKDQRGNKENSIKTAIDTKMPVTIRLSLPIFKGMPPRDVVVEIELDSHGGQVDCYLSSIDVTELQESIKKEIFKTELTPFEEGGITIINI